VRKFSPEHPRLPRKEPNSKVRGTPVMDVAASKMAFIGLTPGHDRIIIDTEVINNGIEYDQISGTSTSSVFHPA